MTTGFNYENIDLYHQYMEFLSLRHSRPSWQNVPSDQERGESASSPINTPVSERIKISKSCVLYREFNSD